MCFHAWFDFYSSILVLWQHDRRAESLIGQRDALGEGGRCWPVAGSPAAPILPVHPEVHLLLCLVLHLIILIPSLKSWYLWYFYCSVTHSAGHRHFFSFHCTSCMCRWQLNFLNLFKFSTYVLVYSSWILSVPWWNKWTRTHPNIVLFNLLFPTAKLFLVRSSLTLLVEYTDHYIYIYSI